MASKPKKAMLSKPAGDVLLLNSNKSSEVTTKVEDNIPDPQAPTDHYLITEFKGDENESDINFVFTNNTTEVEIIPPAACREEILEETITNGDVGSGGEDTKEIIEHVCGQCYTPFRTIKVLKRHMDFCHFKSDAVGRRDEMLKNIKKIEKEALIMEKKDICFCCGDSYDTCHLGHINCADCPKSFKTQLSLERHEFLIHSELNDFPCTVCNGRLRTQSLLKLHTEQHMLRGKPFACKTCGKDFTRQYHLARHHKYSPCGRGENVEKAPLTKCNVCAKTFARLDNLRTHLKTHLGQTETKKAEYMCPVCKKCFYSLSTLNIHIRTHTGERPFDCDLCDKNFPSLVALKKHRRYHTGEKPYTCSVCSQCFAVKEVLNRHMKRHTGDKKHVCDLCDKRFIQATQLKNHLRTHLRPFECTKCDEAFKTKRQLEIHLKTHNSNRKIRTSKYECEACDIKFRSERALASHELTVIHKKNSIKFCPECNEECPNLKSLQFHMLKEHESDDGKCKQCDMVFGQEALLLHHMKTVHNDSMKLLNSEAGAIDKTEKATSGPAAVRTRSSSRLIKKEQIEEEVKKEQDDDEVLEEFIVDSMPYEDDLLESPTKVFTVIAKENEVSPEVFKKPADKKESDLKSDLKKCLSDCLLEEEESPQPKTFDDKDLPITENVGKLLDMLVDAETLVKFGWPENPAEKVLCKVIENCGYDMENKKFTGDYGQRMREYVKLLFTVVIQNDSIKELLNNYPIDEVIDFVLSNDDDE